MCISLISLPFISFWHFLYACEKERMRLWFVVFLVSRVGLSREDEFNVELRSDDFPKDFVFGSGTSAYQVEGAAAGDGRTTSIWDTLAHNGRVPGASNGDVASDEYHKYKEDVKLMEETGLEGYRFPISWSRLIPSMIGYKTRHLKSNYQSDKLMLVVKVTTVHFILVAADGRGDINPKGLEYYNNLIDELIGHGIQPHVTLFHYDLPQILEDEYQGWLSPRIVEFRDRVSYWTTLNEPNVAAVAGYDSGTFPPGRCSYLFGHNCSCGNSVFEPYVAAHNFLLAHSSAYALYKRKYQAKQQGSVGINIFTCHFVPKTDAMVDVLAAKRSQEFYTGWFLRPLVNGDYPDIMKKLVCQKLPKFSRNQSRELVGAFDFIGVNYYNTLAAKDNPSYVPQDQRDFLNDSFAKLSVVDRDESGTKILTAYGLQGVLEYFKQTYGYLLPHNETLDDTPRVRYRSAHIGSLFNAIRNGSNTLGYFTWSFLDAFELMEGYESSYGMYYVDFGNKELKRYSKLSAHWYSHFLKRGPECYSRKQFISMEAVRPIQIFTTKNYWILF